MRPVAGSAAAACALLLAGAAATQPRAQVPTGEKLFRQCAACHALEPNLDTPAGPTLHRAVGRRIAARPGFDYSPALRRIAARHRRWTPRLLDRFLADPARFAPGTEMGFAGLRDAAERRALIDWLRRRPR